MCAGGEGAAGTRVKDPYVAFAALPNGDAPVSPYMRETERSVGAVSDMMQVTA